MRDRERQRQAGGEAGSLQGAWHGTWSRIMPWAEGGAKRLRWATQAAPKILLLIQFWGQKPSFQWVLSNFQRIRRHVNIEKSRLACVSQSCTRRHLLHVGPSHSGLLLTWVCSLRVCLYTELTVENAVWSGQSQPCSLGSLSPGPAPDPGWH